VPPAQQPRYSIPPAFYPQFGALVFQQGPPPVPQPPPKAPKRRALENDDTVGPKSKKARSKGKAAPDGGASSMYHLHGRLRYDPQCTDDTGTSKRGYSAKKRSEAAQIAAQNGISDRSSLGVLLLTYFFSSTNADCVLLSGT
jgi:lysine-specific demethylase 3